MGDISRAILGKIYGAEMESKQAYPTGMQNANNPYKPRTFKENIQDQIAAHKAKIEELQNVLDSMSPEVEKFVEALQKANL